MELDLVAPCGYGSELMCESARTASCSCQCRGINHGKRMRDKTRHVSFPFTDPTKYDPTIVVPQFRLLRRRCTSIDVVMKRDSDGTIVNVPQALVVFSPDGFDWGNGSHASSELALNILNIFVDAPSAWCMHAQYKRQLIDRLPQEGAVLKPYMVRDWIKTWLRSAQGRKTVANYKYYHKEGKHD